MTRYNDLFLTIREVYVQPQEDSLRTREPKAAKEKPKRIDLHRAHKQNLRTMKR